MQVKCMCSEKDSPEWISGFQWWCSCIYTNNRAIFIMIFPDKNTWIENAFIALPKSRFYCDASVCVNHSLQSQTFAKLALVFLFQQK